MILQKSVLLKNYCNYKIGGNADYFYEFTSVEGLKLAIEEYKTIDSSLKSILILGRGTNVLFSDDGYRGLVLKNLLSGIEREGNIVKVSSGVLVDELNLFLARESLSGFEWSGGLPGTVGGAVRGNAGAFGGETKDSIVEVESYNVESSKVIVRKNEECKFDYRQSVFKTEEARGEIIISAKFELSPGDTKEIKDKTQERIDYRNNRHPLESPNIGSIFKNVPVEKVPEKVLKEFESSIKQDPFPVLPVAKLIASTDLVGKISGEAQISTKHPNFIVNLGNAKAVDVLTLIETVKKEIKEEFDINLEEEVMIA